MNTNLYKNVFFSSLYTLLSQQGYGEDINELIKKVILNPENDSIHFPINPKGSSINLERVGDHFAIIIRAYICSARMDKNERQLLWAAIEFWNSQGGKYAYQIKTEDGKTRLPVYFQLMEAPGMYNKSGMFIPSGDISHHMVTYLQIVPDEKMQMLDHPGSNGHTVGYTTAHHIYISDKFADLPIISIHEVGHKIGASHTGQSIMAKEVHSLKTKVKKKTIRDILRKGGLPLKKGSIPVDSVNAFIEKNIVNPDSFNDFKAKIVKSKHPLRALTQPYFVWNHP